jgi:TonB family protein
MTKRDNSIDKEFRENLPEDLRALDEELSGIRIEERASFAPELEGELVRAWKEGPEAGAGPRRKWVQLLLAAGLAGIMITGISVPSARAAVAQLLRSVAQEARTIFEPTPEPELPAISVPDPGAPPAEVSRTEVTVSPADASNPLEDTEPDLRTLPEVAITFPGIASRLEAKRIISSNYPRVLRDAGIDGIVKLLFWVRPDGKAENIQVQETSGSQELDYAAMIAVRDIQFRAATRNGEPVGTWVEVDIRYFALSGSGIIGNDSVDRGPIP